MKFQKRIVNSKRHTLGYVVGGKKLTRGQVVKMVRSNKIDGYYASKKPTGWCVSAKPGAGVETLESLPVIVKTDNAAIAAS